MAEIVFFHSILGLREAERRIAAQLQAAGHRVTLPDLFDDRTAGDYEAGFALEAEIGKDAVLERARSALAATPGDVVLADVSYGAFLVGSLWADLPRLRGALLLCGFAPWMEPRREGLPVSAHIARPDPFDSEEVIMAWSADAGGVALQLHRYQGVGHYFLDRRLPDYDAGAARLCMKHALAFLAALPA